MNKWIIYTRFFLKKLLFYIVQQVHEMIEILDNQVHGVPPPVCVGYLVMLSCSKSDDVSPMLGTIQKLLPVLPGHPDIFYSG